ncbi:hypothetical protein SeLEV6574_g03594 [Synchytrium endobioticum]|nr:hypothetical protein SeLEV6574_g03594 [Synchytrium endobioticum]
MNKRKSGSNTTSAVGIPSSSNPFSLLRNIKKVKSDGDGTATSSCDASLPDQAPSAPENGTTETDKVIPPSRPDQLPYDGGFMGVSYVINAPLSTFVPSSCTYKNDPNTQMAVLAMQPGQTLCFKGSILICPLRGAVSILGALLMAEADFFLSGNSPKVHEPSQSKAMNFYRALSPKSSSLIVIKALECTSASHHQRRAPVTMDVDASIIQNLVKKLNPPVESILVLVKSCIDDAIEGLERAMPQLSHLFTNPVRASRNVDEQDGTSNNEIVSGIRGFTPVLASSSSTDASIATLNGIRIPGSWTDAVEDIIKSSILDTVTVCVIGSKHVGKSTFSRYLTNCLLNNSENVAYLDADLGQPELSPVSTVSLHSLSTYLLGPPFTHLHMSSSESASTAKSVFLGATTPKDEPDAYLDALSELIRARNELKQYRGLPCVVNTCGWVKGMGYDLLVHFILQLKPTHIIHLVDETTPNKNLPPDFGRILSLRASNGNNGAQAIYTVPRIVNVEGFDEISMRSKFGAQDQRLLNLQTYFTTTSSLQTSVESSYTHPIQAQPCSISLSSTPMKIQFIHGTVPFQHTLRALNGSIVGLVIDKNRYDDPLMNSTTDNNSEDGTNVPILPLKLISNTTPLPSKHLHCVGLGLIRSIDFQAESNDITLYIHTPVALDLLQDVNLIIRGCGVEVPVSLLVNDFGAKSESRRGVFPSEIPYVMESGMVDEGIGALPRKVTHRRGFIK